TISNLRKSSRWDPSQTDALKAQLDRVWPFHGTPLVEAMVRAMSDLTKARGFKSLVVLTDGNDSEFEKKYPGSDIPSYLRRTFSQGGIMVNMICFKGDEKELITAKKQFESAVRELDPPGMFYTAKDSLRLVTLLRHSLRQKLVCRILAASGAEVGEIDV